MSFIASAIATLALIVFIAMIGSCVVSGISGALIPLTLRKLGADPATASSIFLTTATDVVIFAIACMGLNILVGFTGQISIGHAAFFGFGAFTSAYLSNRFGIPVFFCIPLAGVVTAARSQSRQTASATREPWSSMRIV